LEEGETKVEALEREVREETGIKKIVRIMKNIYYAEFMDFFKREGCQRLIKEYVYGVEVSSNEKIAISREHSEYRWCGVEEALKLLKWKGNKEALEKLNVILTV
jgi:8-oxo-dGTP pyrophosphatase MutT (NUDIX family)